MLKTLFRLLRQASTRWSKSDAPNWAAAIAFYTMLSAGPLLFVAVSVAGLLFGADAANAAMYAQASALMGPTAAQTLKEMTARAALTEGHGVVSYVIGVSTLLFGATGVFAALQDAMNSIWDVPTSHEIGMLAWLRRRFLSASMVVGVGFMLIASLLLDGVLSIIWQFASTSDRMWVEIGKFSGAFSLGVALLAAMFKFLPDPHLRWRTATLGAGGTAVFLQIGKALIGRYLGSSGVTTPFGAAGSLALVLIWVYYAAQVLLFGAAFTRALGEKR